MELQEMMEFCSDVDLRFTNGTLPAGKAHLGTISGFLRGAIEAHNSNSSCTSNSSSRSSRLQIGMDGVSTEEWMQVARFLYPVPAPAEVQSWQEAELLLRIGAQFDMPLLMQAADRFIMQHTSQLDNSEGSKAYIWKWLKLADHHGLQDSMAAIAAHAAAADREGCSSTANLEQLSWAAMRELIEALEPEPCSCLCHCPRSIYMLYGYGAYGWRGNPYRDGKCHCVCKGAASPEHPGYEPQYYPPYPPRPDKCAMACKWCSLYSR